MIARLRPRRRRDDGASAVEFALVLPILLVLAFGIISYRHPLRAAARAEQRRPPRRPTRGGGRFNVVSRSPAQVWSPAFATRPGQPSPWTPLTSTSRSCGRRQRHRAGRGTTQRARPPRCAPGRSTARRMLSRASWSLPPIRQSSSCRCRSRAAEPVHLDLQGGVQVRVQLRAVRQPRDDGAVAVIVAILSVRPRPDGRLRRRLGQCLRGQASALCGRRCGGTRRGPCRRCGEVWRPSRFLAGDVDAPAWTGSQRAAAQTAAEDAANADQHRQRPERQLHRRCRGDHLRRRQPCRGAASTTAATSRSSSVVSPTSRVLSRSAPPLPPSSRALRQRACVPTPPATPWSTRHEAAPGETFVMDLDNKIGLCNSTAAGNWGIVDFDGGSNPTGDIEDWTEFGYPNPVSVSPPVVPA